MCLLDVLVFYVRGCMSVCGEAFWRSFHLQPKATLDVPWEICGMSLDFKKKRHPTEGEGPEFDQHHGIIEEGI